MALKMGSFVILGKEQKEKCGKNISVYSRKLVHVLLNSVPAFSNMYVCTCVFFKLQSVNVGARFLRLKCVLHWA
jgi:hypothetical protein